MSRFPEGGASQTPYQDLNKERDILENPLVPVFGHRKFSSEPPSSAYWEGKTLPYSHAWSPEVERRIAELKPKIIGIDSLYARGSGFGKREDSDFFSSLHAREVIFFESPETLCKLPWEVFIVAGSFDFYVPISERQRSQFRRLPLPLWLVNRVAASHLPVWQRAIGDWEKDRKINPFASDPLHEAAISVKLKDVQKVIDDPDGQKRSVVALFELLEKDPQPFPLRENRTLRRSTNDDTIARMILEKAENSLTEGVSTLFDYVIYEMAIKKGPRWKGPSTMSLQERDTIVRDIATFLGSITVWRLKPGLPDSAKVGNLGDYLSIDKEFVSPTIESIVNEIGYQKLS